MKRYWLTLMASSVSWLALTNDAAADPATIGSFILLNFLPGLIGSGIGAATVGSIALSALAIGVNLAVGLATAQKIKPQEYKSTFSTGESSEIRAVGRVRVGGLKAFGNTAEFNRYRLICHTKGPIAAVETHYLGGREVTVEADGSVSSPPWARPPTHPLPSYIYVNSKIGDGTETAWTQLLSEFPDLWTAAHRVRGIAQSLVTYISPGLTSSRFLKLYQNIPEYERVQRSELVYDPRDGDHAVDTPSTWEWSENGILNAAHILRSYPSVSSSDFDWDGIEAQATLADTVVDTLTSTEKRARCWGFWPSENPRGDTMQQVVDSIGAEIVPGTDDKILVRLIDDLPAEEITFTSRHIVEIQRRYGPEGVERPNLCIVKYYSPERNYDMAEIDMSGIAWARVEDEIDRYGEKPFTVELPFCPSASQAQRIARRMFLLARSDVGTITLNMAGLAAWGLRYAKFEFPDIGDIVGEESAAAPTLELCAIGTPRVDDENGTVEIPYAVWPQLDSWDPDTMEAPSPDDIPEMEQPSDLTQPSQPLEAVVVEYPDTRRELRVRYTVPGGGTVTEAVYRVYSSGLPGSSQSMTEVDGAIKYAWKEITYNRWADPGFDDPGAHLLGPGWAVTGGKLVNTPFGSNQGAGQNFTLPAGSWTFTGTLSDMTAGGMNSRIVGTPNVDGASITVNGPFSQVLVNASAGTGARHRSNATLSGKVDDVGLHETGVTIMELGAHLDFRVRIFNADGDASKFSTPLTEMAIAIDNTATAAPTQSVTGSNGDWDVETTAPVDLNVAYIQIEKKVHTGSWAVASTQNARPDGLYTLNITDTLLATQTIEIRSRAFTSNGTASAYSSVFSFTEPL